MGDCQRFRNRIGELEGERDALKVRAEMWERSACDAQTENASLRELAGGLLAGIRGQRGTEWEEWVAEMNARGAALGIGAP